MNYREKMTCETCKTIYEWWQQRQHYKDKQYFFGCPSCNKKYPCPNMDDEITLFDDQEE